MRKEAAMDRKDTEHLGRRFREFRETHPVRSRLPAELWAAAAKLARRDGITTTARVLGVDRPSLQKWTDRLEPRTSGTPRNSVRGREPSGRVAPTFVELLAAGTGNATSCVVEVESPQGGKLRLELKSITASQLAELVRAFVAA